MDTIMWRKIARNQNPADIKRVKAEISRTRFNAYRSYGFLRRYLYQEANRLEKNLNCVLKK